MCLHTQHIRSLLSMKDVLIKKRVSTLFLKTVLIIIGTAVVLLCVFSFPNIWLRAPEALKVFGYVLYPGLFGVYATSIPFLFALYQAFKLLHYIDKNKAFSQESVTALRTIKYCAIAMSILYATAMPLVVLIAELDDAPGAAAMGMAVVCAPLVVATFAAVLQKLVQHAIDLQLENDLTV